MRGLLLATASPFLLAGGPPEALATRTTLSAETLRLPGGETLGLLGLSGTAERGSFYLGPGLYGAARGERGGFFTFGLEGGWRPRPFPTCPLELDAGLFVGGGGGAAAPQGGGLMLRPHLGAAYPLGPARLGVQLSRVRFPNGGIDSTQAALTLAFTSTRLWVPEAGWGLAFQGSVAWSGRSLELEAFRLEPAAGTVTRSGTPQAPLDLAGFSSTRDLQGSWFHFLSVAGAAGGSSPGYAQALAGLGLRTSPRRALGLEARLGAGLGGGGDLDTGGGFLVSGEGSLTFGTDRWRGAAGLGLLRAPGGTFVGRTFLLRLAHRFSAAVPEAGGEALVRFDPAHWRVGTGLLRYAEAQRQDGTAGPIQVLALRADRLLARGFYLSGEAGSAVGGGAGGYSTGLAGLGWETPRWAGQRLFAEAATGAGGGGGLATEGGLLTSLRAGWRLELARGWGLEALAGRTRAPRGQLDTATCGLGLHLRFASLQR